MLVKLTYFKPGGKYYSSGEYNTEVVALFEVWEEVRRFRRRGKLPGLIEGGGKDFIILVDAPEHQHNHPRLIVP